MVSLRIVPFVWRTSGTSGPPSVISISPSLSGVTVGYQRSSVMSAPRLQVLAPWLKTWVWRIPWSEAFLLPPAANRVPSIRCARPLQKMLNPVVTVAAVWMPVCGSQTVARVKSWTG